LASSRIILIRRVEHRLTVEPPSGQDSNGGLAQNDLVAAVPGDASMLGQEALEDTPMTEIDTPLSDIQTENVHSNPAAATLEDAPMMEDGAPIVGAVNTTSSSNPTERGDEVEDSDAATLRMAVDTETAEWAEMVRQKKLAREKGSGKKTAHENSSSEGDDESATSLLFCKDKNDQPDSATQSTQRGNSVYLGTTLCLY
jgi:hypothetical protein